MYLGFYGDLTASCLVIKDAESDGGDHPVRSDTLLDQTPCRNKVMKRERTTDNLF